MTTVVLDLENEMLVADKRATCTYTWYNFLKGRLSEQTGVGDLINTYESTDKIHKIRDNVVITGSGCKRTIDNFIKAYKGEIKQKRPSVNTDVLVLIKEGDIYQVDHYKAMSKLLGNKWIKTSYSSTNQNFITLGSGANYAFGAIKSGSSAVDSVKVAAECDPHTSQKFDAFNLKTMEFDL